MFHNIQVIPGLYIGSARDAHDIAELTEKKISYILSIHEHAKPTLPDKEYMCVSIADSNMQDIASYFPHCNTFIHKARHTGNVLVHCQMGISRSASVVVAYLMTVTRLGWKDALRVLKAVRSYVNPNLGFQKQLMMYEQKHVEQERTRIKSQFPFTRFDDEAECQKLLEMYHLSKLRNEKPMEVDSDIYPLSLNAYGIKNLSTFQFQQSPAALTYYSPLKKIPSPGRNLTFMSAPCNSSNNIMFSCESRTISKSLETKKEKSVQMGSPALPLYLQKQNTKNIEDDPNLVDEELESLFHGSVNISKLSVNRQNVETTESEFTDGKRIHRSVSTDPFSHSTELLLKNIRQRVEVRDTSIHTDLSNHMMGHIIRNFGQSVEIRNTSVNTDSSNHTTGRLLRNIWQSIETKDTSVNTDLSSHMVGRLLRNIGQSVEVKDTSMNTDLSNHTMGRLLKTIGQSIQVRDTSMNTDLTSGMMGRHLKNTEKSVETRDTSANTDISNHFTGHLLRQSVEDMNTSVNTESSNHITECLLKNTERSVETKDTSVNTDISNHVTGHLFKVIGQSVEVKDASMNTDSSNQITEFLLKNILQNVKTKNTWVNTDLSNHITEPLFTNTEQSVEIEDTSVNTDLSNHITGCLLKNIGQSVEVKDTSVNTDSYNDVIGHVFKKTAPSGDTKDTSVNHVTENLLRDIGRSVMVKDASVNTNLSKHMMGSLLRDIGQSLKTKDTPVNTDLSNHMTDGILMQTGQSVDVKDAFQNTDPSNHLTKHLLRDIGRTYLPKHVEIWHNTSEFEIKDESVRDFFTESFFIPTESSPDKDVTAMFPKESVLDQ